MAVSAFAPALFLVPGWALTRGVDGLASRPSRTARVAWAWLAGAAWTGAAGFAGSLLFRVALNRTAFVVIGLLPALGAAIAWLARGAARLAARRPGAGGPRRESLALAAWAGLVFLSLLLEAATAPASDFDGRMTWGPLARHIRAERSVLPAALTDGTCYISHPQYPPLVPLLRVALEETLDSPADERCSRPLYAWFFPVFVLVLFDSAKQLAGRRAALAAAFGATLLGPLTFGSNGGPAGTYSDFPLGLFVGGATAIGLLGRGAFGSSAISGLLLGAAVLSKNEGLPLAAASALLIAVRHWKGAGRLVSWLARAAGPAAGASMAALLLSTWRARIPNRFDEDYVASLLHLRSFGPSLDRLADGAGAIGRECLTLRGWWPLLACLAILVALKPSGSRSPWLRPLLLLAAVAPLAGLAAYAVPGWPVRELVGSTWDRLLTQVSMPLLIVLALLVRPWMVRAGGGGTEEPSRRSRSAAGVALAGRGAALLDTGSHSP